MSLNNFYLVATNFVSAHTGEEDSIYCFGIMVFDLWLHTVHFWVGWIEHWFCTRILFTIWNEWIDSTLWIACSDTSRQCDSKVLEEDTNYDKHFSEFQLAELNQAFKANPYRRGEQMNLLAARLNLNEDYTLYWFLRRRTKLRERFLEGDNCSYKIKIQSTNCLLTVNCLVFQVCLYMYPSSNYGY